MKRAAAIILSLTLVWLQVMASAQTTFAGAEPARGCCGCDKRACCVAEAKTDSQPLSALPAPGSAQHELSLLPSARVAWMLPIAPDAAVGDFDFRSPLATAVPLFTRHCAFLI